MMLKGYFPPIAKKIACFMLYLKIINTLENNVS